MATLKQLEARVRLLEEAMERMQVCALVMKGITQELSGVNIDAEVARNMPAKEDDLRKALEKAKK